MVENESQKPCECNPYSLSFSASLKVVNQTPYAMKLKVYKQIATERVRARRLVEGRDLKKVVVLIKNVFPTIKNK
jgi:hypothetical protein